MSKKKMDPVKSKILIVDDSELNRSLLADILSEEYEVLEAENGMKAAALLHEREHEIALMLLDIVMPVMDGFELLALMNKNGWIKTIPVIMISAETAPTYVDRAYDLGVLDYINRPFDERTVRHRVNSTIMMARKQNELSNIVVNQLYENEKNNRLMIEILSNIVEFRNGESGLHVLHIHVLTELILKRLLEKTDKYDISQTDIPLICNASSLHDIGKISIPAEILNKPGRLTPAEFEIMKTHSAKGAEILKRIPLRENEPLIEVGYQICRWHHERYDGRGYPDGLKGEEIPIVAQVVSLADVYDALTSERVYKGAFSHEKAIRMIMDGECGAFNPLLLECLEDISETLKKELNIISLRQTSEMEILNTVELKMEKGEIDVSERTLRLLEHERTKYQFLTSRTHEILFEYTRMPEIMSFSKWGAEYLNTPEAVLNPGESALIGEVFADGNFENFLAKLEETTREQPDMEAAYLLNIHGQRRWHKVIAKTLWSDDESREYEGAIGMMVDIQKEKEKEETAL
jgi:putative two-component system response regulator